MSFRSPTGGSGSPFTGPNPWYDITRYGAVGNDSTDNTTAINNTIAAAQAGSNGGIVWVPPGIYRTAGGHIGSNGKIRIVGAGVTQSVLKLTANATMIQYTAPGVTTEMMRLENLLMTAVGAGANVASIGLEIRDVNYGAGMRDVQVTNLGIGLKTHNFAAGQFVEGVLLDNVEFYNVASTCIQSRRTSGTNSHNNFEFLNVYASLGANNTFWDFGTAGSPLLAYQGYCNAKWNYNSGANGVGIDIGTGSQITNQKVWFRVEGVNTGASPSLNVRMPSDATTEFLYWGACDWGGSTASNFSIGALAIYNHLLSPPGDFGLSGRSQALAVRGKNAASGDIVLGYAGYNNTSPEAPSTTNFAGFCDDGQGSVVLSGLANSRLRVGR